MHWKSLLSAINYEKKKAKDQSSRFHFATNIREDGTFGNDGGQIAVVQTEDPLANEDKKKYLLFCSLELCLVSFQSGPWIRWLSGSMTCIWVI